MNLVKAGAIQTMSSREIADLVDSRHDKVKQSIDRLVSRGVITQPPAGDESYKDGSGRTVVTKIYVFSGEQGKRDSIVVVAQLCPEFTARLVDRWQELEAKAAAPVNPVNLSRLQLIEIAMQAETERLALAEKVEELQPKAQALDRIATADGSLCLTDTAKELQRRPKDVIAWLSSNKWIYKRAGGASWIGYQDRIQAGLLEHKTRSVILEDGTERIRDQVRVTAKGLARLAESMRG